MEDRITTIPVGLAGRSTLTIRAIRWGIVAVEFGIVQLGVQLLSAAAGLLIVRSLPKSEYALFAIANSMQAACNSLADCGIGIGLRAIGGRVWNDRDRFGQLLRTALALRKSFALIALLVTLPVAAWLLWRNGAEPMQIFALCALIGVGVIPLLGSSVWGVSPQLHGELRRIQSLDLGSSALRLLLIAALTLGRMTALLAALVGVIGNWLQVIYLRRWAQDHVETSAPANSEYRRELLRIPLQSFPNTIFFCFQGQVTLFILTFFGNPAAVADITALGRIAVLFAVFSAVFANVFAPRFARCQDPHQLGELYVSLVGASVLTLLPLLFFAWCFPQPLLWLLGEKYHQLGAECGWVVLAGCVGQVGGVMWGLNTSKAWIRWQALGFIPIILFAQGMAAYFLDLRQFRDVLIFNLITAAAPMAIYALDAYWGIKRATPLNAQ